MATLTLRLSKGSPLTHAEVDANFTGLNDDIGTLNSSKITAGVGAITNADIAANAAIAHSKLASITAASVLLGNASNVPTATAVSGDITINNTGVTAISADVIVNADINASAAIDHSKLASITAGSILMGNASNVPTATAVTGDVTISSAGVTAIGAGVIVNADINAAAAIAHSKLANITAGQVLLGNASNVPTATAISGDITLNSSGVAAIGTGVIVNADIDAAAAIAGTKISPDFGAQTIATTGAVTAGASGVTVANGSVSTTIAATAIEVGNGNTTDLAFIDLKADSTYSDYGVRISRAITASGATTLEHRGTGQFRFLTSEAAPINFDAGGINRMHVSPSGGVAFNNTTATNPGLGNTNAGVAVNPANALAASRAGAGSNLYLNKDIDGTYVEFNRDGAGVGSISVASGTVSYNPFLGSHWGRLPDSSRQSIPVGTVLESVDQVVTWPKIRFIADGAELWMPWNGPEPEGTVVSFDHNGTTCSGSIELEADPSGLEKHVCVKISDTPASKSVYGVFLGWINDDAEHMAGSWNDLSVAAVGNYFIRMDAGETVAIGDYVESAGNGCARVQADDVLRASTIAKITSTTPQRTYDDGSFLVTCTLHCG